MIMNDNRTMSITYKQISLLFVPRKITQQGFMAVLDLQCVYVNVI